MMDFDTLINPSVLAMCFADVRRRSRAPGIDGLTPAKFEEEGLEERLGRLSSALVDGSWRPSALVRLRQPKPGGGVRRLAIPTVEDRVVIEVLRRALEPAIEARLSPAAYAYRPRRSARVAVDKLAGDLAAGASWVALADIRDFFDSIPLGRLEEGLDALGCPPRLRTILDRLLNRHALRRGRGLAQGSALSPALSNLLLTPLDTALLAAGHGLVRYCDNLCVPAESEARARVALAAMEREVAMLGLTLKRSESQVLASAEGFVWLGFWLGRDGRRVSDRAVAGLRRRLEAVEVRAGGELRALLRPIIRGWVQYFDAQLPEGAELGRHGAVARELLAECRGADDDHAESPDDDSDLAIEPWDEDDEPEPAGESELSAATRSELLGEADRLAGEGLYADAEALYAHAQELSVAPPPTEDNPAANLDWDDEAIDTFLGLFCAGQDRHEVAAIRGEAGLRDFNAVERPPGANDLRAHLEGTVALAIRPRLRDGTCAVAVLDVDGSGGKTMVAVHAYIEALASVARTWGLEVLIEDTGGRGMHLWFPFEQRISADDVARLMAAIVDAAGRPAEGVRVERLPAGDDAPELHQQAVTLPLGVHVETGARSELRWASGPTIELDLRGLFARRSNDPEELTIELPAGAQPPRRSLPVVGVDVSSPPPREENRSRSWVELGATPRRVMRGCVILRHLADKATTTGHLDHSERLSILYSLGQLGERGKRAVHAIISACDNYDEAETSRQIARLSGLPIGCRRMREKHLTEAAEPLCNCEFGAVRQRGGYPSPVLHGGGFRRAWRAELRRRRTSEALHAESPPAGVAARRETGNNAGGGVVVDRVPPHEWA